MRQLSVSGVTSSLTPRRRRRGYPQLIGCSTAPVEHYWRPKAISCSVTSALRFTGDEVACPVSVGLVRVRDCGSKGVSGLTRRPAGRWGRCRDDRDTERRGEEEPGRAIG